MSVIADFGTWTVTWPWPRLLFTQWRVFGFAVQDTNLYLFEMHFANADWTAVAVQDLGLASLIHAVDVADFGEFYVVSTIGVEADGTVNAQTFQRFLPQVPALGSMRLFNTPTMGTICNFRGQCVGGAIVSSVSPWNSLGMNSVAWSGIGNFMFDIESDVTAGFVVLPWKSLNGQGDGMVHKVLPLLDGVMVYGDGGKVFLQPQYVTNILAYKQSILPGLGIASGNHVAGNEHIHGLIDLHGDFWTLTNNGLTKLGYREYIRDILDQTDPINDTRTIVSYLPRDDRFYISNGLRCLVINKFGAYTTNQFISSVGYAHTNTIYGTFVLGIDSKARIVTDALDYGSRGIKNVESVTFGLVHNNTSTVQAGVDWRMSTGGIFRRSVLRNVNSGGEVRVQVAAVEHRIVLEVSEPIGVEVSSLLSNVKYSDQRFKRGTVPAQYEVGTA